MFVPAISFHFSGRPHLIPTPQSSLQYSHYGYLGPIIPPFDDTPSPLIATKVLGAIPNHIRRYSQQLSLISSSPSRYSPSDSPICRHLVGHPSSAHTQTAHG